MRLREDILAFQKIFEDLKNIGQTYMKRKYHMWSYFMFCVTAFPIIRKKVWFCCDRWSEALLVFHSSSQKANWRLSRDKYSQPIRLKAVHFLHWVTWSLKDSSECPMVCCLEKTSSNSLVCPHSCFNKSFRK